MQQKKAAAYWYRVRKLLRTIMTAEEAKTITGKFLRLQRDPDSIVRDYSSTEAAAVVAFFKPLLAPSNTTGNKR